MTDAKLQKPTNSDWLILKSRSNPFACPNAFWTLQVGDQKGRLEHHFKWLRNSNWNLGQKLTDGAGIFEIVGLSMIIC